MFNNNTGFQINGGKFIAVSGDMNIESHWHPTLPDRALEERILPHSPPALEGSRRGRTGRHRTRPYDRPSRRSLVRAELEENPSVGPSSSMSGDVFPLPPEEHMPYDIYPPVPEAGDNDVSTQTSIQPPSICSRFLQYDSESNQSRDPPTTYHHPMHGVVSPHSSLSIPSFAHFLPDFPPTTEPLHGTTFITTRSVNHNLHYAETGINILHRSAALEALYDSAESFPQPRCHPETRTEMLDDLYEWATAGQSNSMCWLHGPAGAGKSAIMQTLCQRLEDADFLGGAFFFKRGHSTRGNATVLFTTLAYQLALHRRDLKRPISETVETNPSVVGRDMELQLQKLIVEPHHSLENHAPLILLIDGLDECDGGQAQQKILHSIAGSVRQYPSSFRFLIASRPEAQIREVFEETSFAGILKSVNVEQSYEDIRTYLCDEFARIHCEHTQTMGSIPIPWPSSDIIETLVQNSSGYFIYAATVIKFIDDKHFRPTDQLAIIQNLTPNSDSPFATLDRLYTQILSSVPVRYHSKLRDILCAIILLNSSFIRSPQFFEELLELELGDVCLVLRGLHSLLQVNPWNIRPHHASFCDFLSDLNRSSMFYIKSDHQRIKLAGSVLKALSHIDDDCYTSTAWLVHSAWMSYLPSVPPSPELLPLLQCFKPDWFDWLDDDIETTALELCAWLEKFQPIPREVIQWLDDYRFVGLYRTACWFDLYLNLDLRRLNIYQMNSPSLQNVRQIQAQMHSSVTIDACREVLSRNPQLLRIFQLVWVLQSTPTTVLQFPNMRIVLDLSWDDMKAAIRALREITAEEPTEVAIMVLTLNTLCQENATRSLFNNWVKPVEINTLQRHHGANTSDLLRTTTRNFCVNYVDLFCPGTCLVFIPQSEIQHVPLNSTMFCSG
ncbi:putative nwd2 protein [Mycena venus]|uniref:Putative nwd2 protein n=1 Tax=Mycena venus TaxID=2733690 RepID=A0A8H7CER0_9AGAR|nr:putative nwd2 protein [Mycena venus]